MDVPLYARERVEYWENSALDSRIYHVESRHPTIARNPDPNERSVNASEREGGTNSASGDQAT